MTDLIFSFDTEDFTSSHAADGILEAATILREEGIRGCFCIVGLLAEQLAAWGRTDVLEALQHHEVAYHSYAHSVHPAINEYTNTEDFYEGYHEFIRQETAGVAAVKSLVGADRLHAVVAPCNNEAFTAMYGYADMGFPFYCGEMLDSPDGGGVHYCNIQYLRYCISMEEIVETDRASDPALRDSLAARKLAIVYNHPNRWMYNEFWDMVNYKYENKHPFGQWEEAPRMTDAQLDNFREKFRTFVRALKADGRFRFLTYSELAAERKNTRRHLRPEDMPAIAARLRQRFYPMNQPVSLSVADVFSAAVRFLNGASFFAAGRVFGFLDTPYAITAPVTVSAAHVRACAKQIDLTTFLPNEFMVGDTKLGPADFLFAMLGVLEGNDSVTLTPRPQNIDLADFGGLADPFLTGVLFPPEFQAEHLIKRTPLQAWTIRF